MADDKQGRDKQAHDAERRQRERELAEARERGDEAEPVPGDTQELDEFETMLEGHDFPTSAHELAEEFGTRQVRVQGRSHAIGDVFATVDDETYDDATAVRHRIEQQLTHR